jgi:hypothetical protein
MGLLETKRQEDPNATVKLSAADVVDHMHAKSLGGAVLLSQRLADLDLHATRSRGKPDVKAYISATKFLVT